MKDPTNKAMMANTIRNTLRKLMSSAMSACCSAVISAPVEHLDPFGQHLGDASRELRFIDAVDRRHFDGVDLAFASEQSLSCRRGEQRHRRATGAVVAGERRRSDDRHRLWACLGQHRRAIADPEVTVRQAADIDDDLVVSCGRTSFVDVEGVEGVVGDPWSTEDRSTHVRVADHVAVGADDLGPRLRMSFGDANAIDVVDHVDQARVQARALATGHLVVERQLGADVAVGALVGLGEQAVEAAADGVGEDQRAGHECDAEQYGEAGDEEPHLAGSEVLEDQVEHGAQSPKFFMRSSTRSAVGSVIWSTI